MPQKGHLFDVACRQKLHLVHNVVNGPAYLAASPVGDDAERTELVAAVDDGDVRRDRDIGRGERGQAALGVYAHAVAEQFQKRPVVLGAHEGVHVGEPGLKVVRLGPHHAAHQSNYPVAVALL